MAKKIIFIFLVIKISLFHYYDINMTYLDKKDRREG